jgi:hypothetical protein
MYNIYLIFDGGLYRSLGIVWIVTSGRLHELGI